MSLKFALLQPVHFQVRFNILIYLYLRVGDDDLELLSLPPQLKEKYIRLQTENRLLNKKISEGGDRSALQSSLDDAQSRINDLESENR